MTVKEYLAQTLNLNRMINSKIEQLMELRASATAANAIMSDMPKSGSPELQSLQETVVKIVDLEREVTADIDMLVNLKREIMAQIKCLPSSTDRLLLEQRYLCCKSLMKVASFLGYDIQYIHKRHNRAMAELEKISPKIKTGHCMTL